MSKTKILFSGLFLAIFMVGNAYSGNIGDVSALSITFEQNPADQYQLAKSTFLPETYDDLGLSGRHNTKYDFNKNDCSAYPLKSCPSGSKCDKCPVGAGYRLNSCTSPYILSGGTCTCPATVTLTFAKDKCIKYCDKKCIEKVCAAKSDSAFCTNGTQEYDDGCGKNTAKCCIACADTVTTKPANSSYTYSSCKDDDGTKNIQTGWACNSGYHKTSSNTCEKDCNVTNCAGYTLSSCPANGTCSTCTKTAANCSTDGTMYRLDSCATGYTKSGDACIILPKTEIGDILYSDLTTGKPDNHASSGKTAIGVVFDAERKLAVSLENENKSWFDRGGISVPGIHESWDHPKNTYKGKEYTKTIVDYCKANGKNCLAAKYSYLFTTQGTHIGDWYLPSVSELNLIYNNKKTLNNTLSVIKGMQITDDKHWASEKCSSASPYYRDFSKTENEYNGIGIAANKVEYNVRPIINYSDINGTDKPIADVTPELPYLYSDFTTSTNIDKNKIIIGIVFNKDKKLAISTEYKDAIWATENFDVPTINNYTSSDNAKADWNGKANTNNGINYCKTNNKSCPAISYAYTYRTAGTKSGDWYLPATGELNDLFTYKDKIDKNLNLLRNTNLPEYYYWSSTEVKGTCSSCSIGQAVQSAPNTIASVTKDTTYTTAVPIINYGTITPNPNTSRNAAQCIASDCELETNCYNRGLKTSYCNEKYSQCQSCCNNTPDKNCYHVY